MTAAELKNYFRTTLVAQRSITQEYSALDAIVDFITQAITSGIPDWTNALTFNLDGSGAGSFCTEPDDNGAIRFWKTKTDGNVGNQPPTNPAVTENTYWIEVSPSDGSAIKEHSAGVYGTGLIIVYHNHSTDGRGLYILIEPVRPFNSTNIETEITGGKWALLFDSKENKSEKGQANGYASLDGTGKVPAAQLPSYVDDVLEYANLAAFPVAGEAGIIYIAVDTNLSYRWSGSVYVLISSVPNDASETVKGIVEEATDAEVAAGTAVGGTGGKLFVTPAKLITWWPAIKAAAQSIAGLWTFAKAKLTHGAFGYTALVDAANIAWNADTIGNIAQVTLGGNRTLDAITNPQTGGIYILRVVQDGTGGRTLTFNAAFTFPETSQQSISTVAGAATTFIFYYDGTGFRFITNGAKGKLNIGSNTEFENLPDASDIKGVLMLSRLGALERAIGMEWDDTLKQLRFSGSTALLRAGAAVSDGNFGLEAINGATEGFKEYDSSGSYRSIGLDSDGKNVNRFSKPIRLRSGANFIEIFFISQSCEASVTTDLLTIATDNDQLLNIEISCISCFNADKDYIIGKSIHSFKNDAGAVTNISQDSLRYTDQYSSIKSPDGAVTNSDTRIDCAISGENVIIQFVNTVAKSTRVRFEYKYIITPIPS